MQVSRELYIAAPSGIAVYAQSPCYAALTGESLVEAIKHEGLVFDTDGRRRYYHPRIFRRRSDDNGRAWTAEADLQARRLQVRAVPRQ